MSKTCDLTPQDWAGHAHCIQPAPYRRTSNSFECPVTKQDPSAQDGERMKHGLAKTFWFTRFVRLANQAQLTDTDHIEERMHTS